MLAAKRAIEEVVEYDRVFIELPVVEEDPRDLIDSLARAGLVAVRLLPATQRADQH